jgi:hypothetical protein
LTRDHRRLAAIVIADVVGFSRHMERDDAGTLARLREIREQLIDSKISEYGGHVVKTKFDSLNCSEHLDPHNRRYIAGDFHKPASRKRRHADVILLVA